MVIKAKKEFTEIRIIKGFSLNQLAKKIQMDVSVLSRMESGNTIRPMTAKKICNELEKTFEELFEIID